MDLPVVAQIIEASPEKPYFGLMFKLDQNEISQMMVDSHMPLPRKQSASRGIAVSKITLPVLEIFHHHHFRTNDSHEPVGVSETAEAQRSTATDADKTYGCFGCGLPGWLRQPFPVQPRIQSFIWCTAIAGY